MNDAIDFTKNLTDENLDALACALEVAESTDAEECAGCGGEVFVRSRGLSLEPGEEEECECGTVNVAVDVDSPRGGFTIVIRAKQI